MSPFTAYTGPGDSTLTNALLAPSSGITIDPGSIVLDASGPGAVNFYDGTLAPLGIGSGLLLTSGTTPGTANTVGWFGQDNSGFTGFNNGDADINAVVNTVFQTVSYDATVLQFDFTVADPTATSVSFDLVFGSDEFPEWVDQFVDSAIVMVNGVNYALFNHDPAHPLSVVSGNLAAGYFQDNATNAFPIEYDGVSHVLKIVAPINAGATNHIKIGIADTGDHIYDSGVFLANFTAGNIPGSGVVSTPTTGTTGDDTLTGSSQAELFDCDSGNDVVYAGGGDDIVVAGSGNDSAYGGSGADEMKGDAGDDSLDGGDGDDTAVYAGDSSNYTVSAVGGGFTISDSNTGPTSEGADTLTNVEFVKFSNGLFAIGAGGVLTPVTDPGTPPSNSPGSVVITGIASAGKTLTATVSDPDGLSAASVSYQWQVSADNGATWSNVGDGSNTYSITAADVGNDIQVVASYFDNASQAESPVSAAKTVLETNNGDLVVTLIQLDAPAGTSVINPLTTLLKEAIDLGASPNTAALAIKAVLGLPDAVNLQTYDAYAALQADPNDPTALAVEKVMVEIAILTSLSDDDTGVNLTLKILDAAANNQTLDLADANDLANILGIDITGITDKKLYPEPLREIFDRHENIAQAANVSDIEVEWQDFLSIQDNVNSTSIADLSIHVNQAPTGSATASLAGGLENTPYTIDQSDLLQGFSDPDGGTLSVSGLSADNGSVTDNLDGTFTVTPTPGFNGPIELTYTVIDGQGGSAPASQLFVIAPNVTGVTINGTSGNDRIDAMHTVAGQPLPTDLNDTIAGAAGNDVIDGLGGADSMIGGTGNDKYYVDNAGDIVTEALGEGTDTVYTSVDYALAAGSEVEQLRASGSGATGLHLSGNEYANRLFGGSGADTLDGGTGADVLTGGAGNDTYVVDHAGDKVTELAGQGTDTVETTQSAYTLGANVDDLTFTGAGNFTGVGNDLANHIVGGSGDDLLNGKQGADLLTGNGGNDTYCVDNLGDVVVENPGDGVDTVRSSVKHTLEANVENLVLTGTASVAGTGNDLDNQITGNSGNNLLDGGIGADTMTGGLGNDTYVVDNIGDQVTENPSAGNDKVQTSLDSYHLTPDVESLIYTGAGNFAGTGNSLANQILGGAGTDTLDGGVGNDTLNGGSGADSLTGGQGNDTFIVDDGGDVVSEAIGDGTDTVKTTLSSFLLGDNVDNLKFTGIGGFSGTGNDLANQINGGTGDDSLSGGAGADTLAGSDGNDVLIGGIDGDMFVFNGIGADVVMDYTAGADQFDLIAIAGLNSYADIQALMADQTGGLNDPSVLVDFGGGNSLLIHHTTIADLDNHQADFLI